MSKKRCNFHCSFTKDELCFNYLKSVTKPKFKKDGWDDIEMEILDTDDNSQLNQAYQLSDMINNQDEFFPFNLIILDNYGEEVENWHIFIEEIIEIDFGFCDYYETTNQIIKITMRPSKCYLL